MRTKDEVFQALITDAVASTYRVPGLRKDRAVSDERLRKLMDAAGLLYDVDDDGNRVDEKGRRVSGA